jgi:hypothetical protein
VGAPRKLWFIVAVTGGLECGLGLGLLKGSLLQGLRVFSFGRLEKLVVNTRCCCCCGVVGGSAGLLACGRVQTGYGIVGLA